MTLVQAQAAARAIEIDGVYAYHTVSARYGKEIALVLVVAHLRRAHGAMDSYPPHPGIDDKVEAALREVGIFEG